ncbi:alpha/beta hydrolase family protein [Devosia lacusdianchii]|uniref:alpha/beta hydrolase family protein n=1 Tax=Devosia lacusdianchii TaxID=2917991 RepID=UPI001F053565|nr:alpha/beta hydrolase [Devosia sp. JXJ CY 41]
MTTIATKIVATSLLALAISQPALAAETIVTLDQGVVGTLSVPEGGATGPAVVMLHGFASSRDEIGGIFAAQAAALAEAGIASLRIDFRGYGDSAPDTEASVTIDRMLEDAGIARTYLADIDGVDADRVGVLGYSFGAAIAMLDQENYPAIAVWGQMGDLKGEFLEFLGQPAFDTARATGNFTVDRGWRVISLDAPFFDSVEKHDLAAAFAGYDGPFLTLAGADDPATGYFEQYLGLAAGPKTSVVIPATDHMLGVYSEQPEIAADVIAQTTTWFGDSL